MSWQFAPHRIVKWPARIAMAQDGGTVTEATCVLHVRLLTPAEWASVEQGTATSDAIRDLVLSHVVGWDDVTDETGAIIPFSAEVLRAILDADTRFLLGAARALAEATQQAAPKT